MTRLHPSLNGQGTEATTLPSQPGGLYDPQFEHDACGIAFVVNVDGEPSHQIVTDAVTALKNLQHRGACGSDPETGDGAGILMQIPDRFFQRVSRELGFDLPPAGEYATGTIFLPKGLDSAQSIKTTFEEIAGSAGLPVQGWRDVLQHSASVGPTSRSAEPHIVQVFLQRNPALTEQLGFERALFVLRRRIERIVAESGIPGADAFYIASLSSRTIVYKGMLSADQIDSYYPELTDPDMQSALALVHQRFSTNTFPSWPLAHPYRYVAHNGEINTLRGNVNWMRAREALFETDVFDLPGLGGSPIDEIKPVIREGISDSGALDNALELLLMSGRALPEAVMMLVPEPWQKAPIDPVKRDFYDFNSALMEPWDGPAAVVFTDGSAIGAVLDRNGLRPARYYETTDGRVIFASEVGVLHVPPAKVRKKGRLEPGRMLLVDTERGGIISDDEVKHSVARQHPYGEWLAQKRLTIEDLPTVPVPADIDLPALVQRQLVFGYTEEEKNVLLAPMAINGEEPIGSMGMDTPLAVLSERPQLLFHYFKQLFAQVTNPPLDAIREEVVTSLNLLLGPRGNLLEPGPESARQIEISGPILTNEQLARLRASRVDGFQSCTLPITFPVAGGASALEAAIDQLCNAASEAIDRGCTLLVLSDRNIDRDHAAIPSLLATSAVHHHLLREGTRLRASLIVETGEAREVHHFCTLIGFGASAINPYLAFETIEELVVTGDIPSGDVDDACQKYVKAVNKGVLKVMSKMGISTVDSYHGAQIFEALGIDKTVIGRHFTGTASRIGGVGLQEIGEEALARHRAGFPDRPVSTAGLPWGGQYHWRKDGEYHLFNPETVYKLQHSAKSERYDIFKEYTRLVDDQNEKRATIRGLLDFKFADKPVPIDEVESVESIVKRFATGAMSFGALSKEAHETLAIAMNRLGGMSNSGEGGEDPDRFTLDPNGDSRSSAIKQVASGRFGVTSHYLVNAKELQIKMAQGAKPGEGGQLPGGKVDENIARVRHSTPGVGLISPPPHHDIYSIEDLAQLIFDLKNANPRARISVKLVAAAGVGTVAAGVSKAKADVVLISGHDGGTGASPLSSLAHTGIPWEIGLAETQQVLVKNGLRSRITVQTDGQLKTGRDVVVAALLGAEEYGFSTAPLVVMGCILMRVCHMNTCPVGVATQNADLRKRFSGQANHVVNFFRFVAQEIRELMAKLGFRTIDEMIGRVDKLDTRSLTGHWKSKNLDFSTLLQLPSSDDASLHKCEEQDHGIDDALDHVLMEYATDALDYGWPVWADMPIRNENRTMGAMLGSEITRRYGADGLGEDTIRYTFHGSAGQSFGAFIPPGLTLKLEGDANDHVGKGLSGGKIIVYPPKSGPASLQRDVVIGNVALYGATGGELYVNGVAGERFAVRNSGAHAVVEGVGDHGCEYMTGGRIVVLGSVGRNFAAGMSGGIAYVLDLDGTFAEKCNQALVDLEPLSDQDLVDVHRMIKRHVEYTGSLRGQTILESWEQNASQLIKVMPREFRRVLESMEQEALETTGAVHA
jgi:glutamate synthase domain-containing protein 2/glutamate synthase domain-containing protein 1/glutamate synthase domain-containing protein 3